MERRSRAATVPLFETTGVSKRFGSVSVLRGVSISVGRGEVVALVGETGAGKSSLVACLARILDADAGEIRLDGQPLPGSPDRVRRAGVEVVWQDHGLCDDLDAVANIFLGREDRLLGSARMREQAAAVLRRLGADHLPLDRSVGVLSRGQRQLVAMARALLPDPRLLILDEPTASLGVVETLCVQAVIREARDAGMGILLATHDLEQVFGLADRVVVLRQGRVVADVSAVEVQRADVIALMSGIETDSVARRQLDRLRSLVDQLSDVEPSATLPLILSAMAAALDQEMLCVHLLHGEGDGEPVLHRSAAVGLPQPLLDVNHRLPIGAAGGCAGLAAEAAEAVVVEDVSLRSIPSSYHHALVSSGIRSEWAAPIVGTGGVLGTVSGFETSVGRPPDERLELARLYLGYAASAIEQEALRHSQAIQRELLSSLSHELRTPLTAIQGYASTLRQPDLTWSAESTQRFLRSIAEESARVERLVGALLDSSAIESGILRLQRDWCDLQLVVEAAGRCVADGSGIRVVAAEKIEPVWADHDRLEQVFVNLLENAVTHGASRRGVEVTLRRGRAVDTVEVEVRDRGRGVPPELATRIFEPRMRGDGQAPGAGLGLSIARGIVEAHGGSLVTAPAEPGASFVVTLPTESTGDGSQGQPDAGWSLADGRWVEPSPTDRRSTNGRRSGGRRQPDAV
jgi:signal transduction histidine kinase/ABC-type multidrug transport system ATPase subunit